MSLKLNEKYLKNFIKKEDYEAITKASVSALHTVLDGNGAGNDFLGWRDLPEVPDRDEYERIKKAATKIRKSCDVLLVIGIGGSYLGARAAIEFCLGQNYNETRKEGTPAIYFIGNSISPSSVADLFKMIENRDVCLNVISKSGTTTEPAIAFRIFREFMEKKYKDGAAERIFITTDRCKGKLKELSTRMGYETFVVPDDVGGRFSVLSPVGLLPIAVAGINLDDMLKGANDAKKKYTKDFDINTNDCLKYAAIRNILYKSGKSVEVLASYEPSFVMTSEWWKQLYGESEGKGKKGIFPASVCFTTDLHSLGQFIQDGSPILFETVLDLQTPKDSFTVPFDQENTDGLNFLAEKTLHDVNRTAFTATAMAHVTGGVPNVVLEIESRSAYDFGFMVFFFELACAISGYILNVNPFNQPGVEAYKKNMFALLGKEGEEFDKLRKALSENQ